MKKITIITGHYGSGKTNLAVNLALRLADAGEKVTIVDFDIVNPYFRTADFAKLFEERGVTLAASMYANTSLDIPAISFDMERMAYEDGYLIIDVGGDDAGAIGLGRYAEGFSAYVPDQLDMWYVVNRYRYLTEEPQETLELMYEIEAVSRMRHTGIEQLQSGEGNHGGNHSAGSALCGRNRRTGEAAAGLHHLPERPDRFCTGHSAGRGVCQAGVGGIRSNLHADGVQSRQTLFVRYCPKILQSKLLRKGTRRACPVRRCLKCLVE